MTGYRVLNFRKVISLNGFLLKILRYFGELMATKLVDNRDAWEIADGLARELISQKIERLNYPSDIDVVSGIPNQLGYGSFSDAQYKTFINMVNGKIASYIEKEVKV